MKSLVGHHTDYQYSIMKVSEFMQLWKSAKHDHSFKVAHARITRWEKEGKIWVNNYIDGLFKLADNYHDFVFLVYVFEMRYSVRAARYSAKSDKKFNDIAKIAREKINAAQRARRERMKGV